MSTKNDISLGAPLDTSSVFKGLLFFAGKYKYLTFLGMFLSMISACTSLLTAVFIWLCVKEIFSVYPNVDLARNLKLYAWLTLGSAIITMLIYFAALICTHISAFRIARNMRLRAISHLMSLGLGYFNAVGSGKLRRIIDDSAASTETYLAHQLPDLVGALVTPIYVLILLFIFDWRLGLISLIPIVLSWISLKFMRGDYESVVKYQNELANMNNGANEYIRGIPVVKTFGQTIFSFKKFNDAIESYQEFVIYFTRRSRLPMVLFQTFLGSTAAFLSIGGILIFSQQVDPKSFLLVFLFYVFFSPVAGIMMNKIMWTSQHTFVAKDAINRLGELLKLSPLKQPNEDQKINSFNIELNNVSFSYDGHKDALKNISMSIKEGQRVALVGESGGGKSTIAMLIARFFDVNNGSITIGGIDVKDIKESTLMNSISFVFQDINLLKTSILNNLRESKQDASNEEILKVLNAAQCEDIIDKLPSGIHTLINAKGVYLSGGEMQRISIAGAMLKGAPIILLDEATAFSDPENEYKIQLAFNELTKGKTLLMIAHRLSTIQQVDKIYVIHEGMIKEEGRHEELINNNGMYVDMWKEYQYTLMWNKDKDEDKTKEEIKEDMKKEDGGNIYE